MTPFLSYVSFVYVQPEIKNFHKEAPKKNDDPTLVTPPGSPLLYDPRYPVFHLRQLLTRHDERFKFYSAFRKLTIFY